MMDELELLKKDWQKKGKQLPKLSYDDIHKMLWKKSSSLVKWIFYISIGEFIFWIILGNIPLQGDAQLAETKYTDMIASIFEYLGYGITLFFVIKFYLNYRKISTEDSTRELMKNIIRVRKTVMTYVWISLALFASSLLVLITEMVFFEPEFSQLIERASDADNPLLVYGLFFFGVVMIIALFGGVIWLFYRLLYGILLKRLNSNYRELQKLEV